MEVSQIVWVVIFILFLSGLSYYIYRKYFKIDSKEFVPNNEYIPEPKKYECILFYTSWCPHCKKTIKDWDNYKVNNEDENAIFSAIDCDRHVDKADFYEIDSYPTIIMLYKDKKYIFDSDFNRESMDKFVSTILKI
jgi:thiol-disulfide isomerase/thioredoxin